MGRINKHKYKSVRIFNEKLVNKTRLKLIRIHRKKLLNRLVRIARISNKPNYNNYKFQPRMSESKLLI